MRALSAAQEDYLETILALVERKGAARVGDIAAALAVHKSTVTAALRGLLRKGLIHYAPYASATLTDAGAGIARRVADKRVWIRRFLTDVLLLDERLAERNACRMEHAIDGEVIARLTLFAKSARRRGSRGRDRCRRFAGAVRGRGRPAGGGARGRPA